MGRGQNKNQSMKIRAQQVQESKDSLGDRMKDYEKETKIFLPKKSLTIVRLDGRSFHTWTKGLQRPYDEKMIQAMIDASTLLCKELSGAVIGYTQSDETSILLSDNQKESSEAIFNGNIQKIASVAASAMTGYFNKHFPDRPLAMFDARVFSVPSKVEAINYFLWRQKDAQRNAISALAENHFSAKELHGVSTKKRKELLEQQGIDLSAISENFRQGTLIESKTKKEKVKFFNKRENKWEETKEPVTRSYWQDSPAGLFRVKEDNLLWEKIPEILENKEQDET